MLLDLYHPKINIKTNYIHKINVKGKHKIFLITVLNFSRSWKNSPH